MLKAKGLGFKVPGGRFHLSELEFAFSEGQMILLCGPNGSGKSTLLRLMAGLAPQSMPGQPEGVLHILGKEAWGLDPSDFFGKVAFLGSRPASQLFCATVRAEILFGLQNLRLSAEDCQNRLNTVTHQLPIKELLDCNPRELSGGQQKLVLLAALLALQPQILLLDEPLSHLSQHAQKRVVAVLRQFADTGRLVVVSEHETEHLTPVIDHQINLHQGRMAPQTIEPPRPLPQEDRQDPRRTAPMTERLSCRNLSFGYPGKLLLSGQDLSLGNGITLLVGENGSGKSTLLKILRGLLKPQSGEIFFDGRPLPRPSELRGLSLVMQDPQRQFFCLTVREEIQYGLRFLRPKNRPDLSALYDYFGLGALLEEPPFHLSAGEKRRVALAATLALQPNYLLLDEPTGALDPFYRGRLSEYLISLAQKGTGQLIATHKNEGALYGDCTEIELSQGRLRHLKTSPMRTL